MAANLSRSAAPAQPPLAAEVRKGRVILPRDSGRFSVQCSPGAVPTTCVVGSLPEIPTRQYQAAARKKPCKGNVLVGTQTIAFTALLGARRELIAQSSSKRTAS